MVSCAVLVLFWSIAILLAPFDDQAATAPANDDFSAAQPLTQVAGALTGSTNGSNVGATWQSGEPEFNTGNRSVWYRWRAPVSGIATFDTTGSSFNTLLAIYTQRSKEVYGPDALGNLEFSWLFSDMDPRTNLQSRASFSADAGHKYWIVVDGAGGAEGEIALSWNLVHDGRFPDMIVGPFHPSLGTPTFASNDCVIGHRCASTGTRRLLRFGTLTINIGNADLFPGESLASNSSITRAINTLICSASLIIDSSPMAARPL